MSIIFASFGCWNEGCKTGSEQKSVIELLKRNQERYKFLVILGDNYYSEKKKFGVMKYHDINIEEMKKGFDCLNEIKIPKKLILGNHDLEEGILQSCNNTKLQLNLPWYDVKFPFAVETHFLDSKEVKMIYLDTTVYELKSQVNTCYEYVIGKSALQVYDEQNRFIFQEFNNITNDNIVVIFGHEPLITFRFKKTVFAKNELVDIIFEAYERTKTKHNNVKFYYVCADFHTYENAIISKDGSDLVIEQIVLGTGGKSELDKRYESTPDRLLQLKPYNYVLINTEPRSENGYGELVITNTGLTHSFIGIGNSDPSEIFLKKYLKYKKKYLQLKKN